MNFLSITEKDKILIVAPHPDDECIGVGGLLSLYPKQCHVLVLTDGRIGQNDIAPSDLILIRKRELENELSSIGVSFDYLGLEDGTLSKYADILNDYDLSCYSKIFVTGDQDGHPDHTAAYVSVQTTFLKNKYDAELYLYEVHNPLQSPSHMLDITSVIEQKEKLIRYHKSQISAMPYDKMVHALSEYRALQNRIKNSYLEVYEKKSIYSSTEYNPMETEIQKQRQFYRILTKWMKRKNEGWSIGKALKENGISTVCIYGYAELGELVTKEIEQDEFVTLRYILDKKKKAADKVPVYVPSSNLEKVDCVIVTAVYYFDEIYEELTNLGYKNIISLKEVVENAV